MTKKVLLALVLVGGLFSLLWLTRSQSRSSPASSMPSKEAVSAKLATLDRGWVKNEGQWDKRALFSAPGYFGTTWITKDGQLVHVAIKGKESWVISERWVGGKVQAITPEEELPTKVSYFIGNDPSKHKTNLPTYRYVSLGEVWSGVEVKLKATQKTVEKLFYIKPGADPSKIVVEVDGAEGLKLSKDGEIIIQTGLGKLKLSKPIAWQEKDGKKLPVEVSYKLVGKNRYSFKVAKADPSLPIVIDPILQATYLGGSGSDKAFALAIHPTTGEIYVAGRTLSTDFPKTYGGAQENHGGASEDAFVARLNRDLTRILQATYLGGSDWDAAQAIAIHPTTGEVYVAGYTYSTNFPGTSRGAQANHGGRGDAFVARLNRDLTRILQSTYLGGSNSDLARALAIHPQTGEVYVAGETYSKDFPGITGGAQTYGNGSTDAFVSRLNRDLTQILQSTYLGGNRGDFADALAIHPITGEVYVAGYTDSTDFPSTNGGAQPTYGGDFFAYDAFIARLNSSLTRILQSTYLGGNRDDFAEALAIHPTTGEVYVAGWTVSNNFPNTAGGAQASCSDCLSGPAREAFVSRLNRDLTQILQSTYLGGGLEDYAYALAIHPQTGEVYVAGETYSNDFPGTNGGAQPTPSDLSICAFIARLNSSLTRILQSTYLGGDHDDFAFALAIHPTTGEVYVAGWTNSNNFPNTTGGAQASCNSCDSGWLPSYDAFVARLTADLAAGSGSGGSGSGGSGSGTGGSSGGSGSGSGGSGTGGSGSGSGGGTGSGGGIGGTGGGGGGGCSMTGSASSMAGLWNILVWASLPVFALARRIRGR